MNTFGEEIFHDENVLRSYFYAIYDLSIGGMSVACLPPLSPSLLCPSLTPSPDAALPLHVPLPAPYLLLRTLALFFQEDERSLPLMSR